MLRFRQKRVQKPDQTGVDNVVQPILPKLYGCFMGLKWTSRWVSEHNPTANPVLGSEMIHHRRNNPQKNDRWPNPAIGLQKQPSIFSPQWNSDELIYICLCIPVSQQWRQTSFRPLNGSWLRSRWRSTLCWDAWRRSRSNKEPSLVRSGPGQPGKERKKGNPPVRGGN